MGKQGIFLKHSIELAFIRRQFGNVIAAENNLSLIRPLKAADNPQGSSFSAAAGSKKGDESVFLY